jgi:peptidoglycan glycosyltransferase
MLPNPSLDFFSPLPRGGAWPPLALGLRLGLLIGMALLLIRLARENTRSESGAKQRLPAAFRVLLLAGGVLLLARQASWQLLGRQREEFVSFMQKYDRREFNPAHRVRAGRILDRNGVTLAVSRVTDRGIRRFYPLGPMTAHAVGYNHPVYGMTGIEAAYRSFLLGQDTETREQWLDLGKSLLDREAYAEGPALYSTLHAGLQRTAVELLDRRRGAVVMLDVETGGVLVLASSPGFDPNRLSGAPFQRETADAPFVNRALAGRYPPGSVWKPLVAAAALNHGFQGRLDTPAQGYTPSPANPPIRDHEYYAAQERGDAWRGRGRIGLGDALVHSSNTFFARLGVETGAGELNRTVSAAGLLRNLFPLEGREESMRIPAAAGVALTDARPYDIAQFSIGQGEVLVSPVQVAVIMAGIANQGLCLAPRLVLDEPVRPLGRLCSPDSADTLKWMLYNVVQNGTGQGIRLAELPVAGKTGTAQTGSRTPSHSWFAGFAPVSRPQWAFCVLVEHGGYGSQAALPLARELLTTGVRERWLAP